MYGKGEEKDFIQLHFVLCELLGGHIVKSCLLSMMCRNVSAYRMVQLLLIEIKYISEKHILRLLSNRGQ